MLGLLKKDQIIPQRFMTPNDRRRIEEQTGRDYIIERIGETVYKKGATQPHEKPKGPGSRVFALVSPTGTGKSALIAPAIYDEFKNETKRGILLTQPVRATVMDIPFQITKYNKHLIIGDNIGYQTGTIVRKPRTGILVCTIGILAQFLKNMDDEQFMRKYAFILLDEVHIRSIELDICLYLLEKLLSRQYAHPLCPTVVLMSGTFDPAPLMKYFGCPASHLIEVRPTPSFPIVDHFTAWDLSDYGQYVEDLVARIHVTNLEECQGEEKSKHILCFMHSTAAITAMVDRIDHLNAVYFGRGADYAAKKMSTITNNFARYIGGKGKKTSRGTRNRAALLPIPLLSALISAEGKEYAQLYARSTDLRVTIYGLDKTGRLDRTKIIGEEPVARKVLLGTNAIETGLTINNLRYCIDTGFVKDVSWQPNYMADLIIDRPISRASMVQRKGRVGRTAPGLFFGCYTEETVRAMHAQQQPDIVRNNAAQLMLSILVSETGSSIARQDVHYKGSESLETKQANNLLPYSFQMNQLDQYWYAPQFTEAFDFTKLKMFQLPPSDAVISGFDQLYSMGFMTSEYLPTAMGIYANQIRKLSLPLIRMIFAAYHTGASVLDVLTMACFMGGGELLKIDKRKYLAQNVLRGTDEEARTFAARVVQDECIEYLFLWYAILDVLERIVRVIDKRAARMKVGMSEHLESTTHSKQTGRKKINHQKTIQQVLGSASSTMIPVNYITDFAEQCGVQFQGILAVIAARDELINDMLTLGLDPYYNGLGLQRGTYSLPEILRRNRTEGLQEIGKIKQCIYEGYRFNLCTYDTQKNQYICSANNVAVKVQGDFFEADTMPRCIIPTQILITSRPGEEYDYQFVGRNVSVLDDYVAVDLQFLRA